MAANLSLSTPEERLQAWVAEFISPVHATVWPDETATEVVTPQGTLRGMDHEGVRIFRGIRYAEPPTGERRFAPPVKVTPWQGVKDATRFGPMSLQAGEGDFSEDCLSLNVWTPAGDADEALPVFVFIHGGGYVLGAGSQPLYEGTGLARKGMVVVTINYRLGTLGFLPASSALSEHGTTGNWGILDMIAALQWVQDNIRAFGGDPDRVTVGGESAGSYAVSTLIVSPLTRGLFHQAIMQSGSLPTATAVAPASAASLTQARQLSATFFSQFGLADDAQGLATLRQLPAEEIMAVTPQLDQQLYAPQVAGFWPVPDGHVYQPEPVSQIRGGNINQVTLLAGFNTDEGSLFVNPDADTGDYRALIHSAFGATAEDVLARFPIDENHTVSERMNEIITLGMLRSGHYQYANALSQQNNVYLYHFDFVDPALNSTGLGVIHGSEIKYIFHNFMELVNQDTEARDVSVLVQTAWVNFIKNGNPNTGNELSQQVIWQKYSEKSPEEFHLCAAPSMQKVHRLEDVLFINEKLIPQRQ